MYVPCSGCDQCGKVWSCAPKSERIVQKKLLKKLLNQKVDNKVISIHCFNICMTCISQQMLPF